MYLFNLYLLSTFASDVIEGKYIVRKKIHSVKLNCPYIIFFSEDNINLSHNCVDFCLKYTPVLALHGAFQQWVSDDNGMPPGYRKKNPLLKKTS